MLIKCHAGCDTEAVMEALGLEMRALFPSEEVSACNRYVYQDESGAVIARKVRTARAGKKSFYWERPDDNGGWSLGLEGLDPGLYHVDEVRRAIEGGRAIWVVEGEKDVESLRERGEVATCNPDGAGPHKWRPKYTETLRGADVTVVADRDEPGYRHAREIVTGLEGVARSVRVCEAREGKDVSDHLATGLELNDLVPLTITELEERAGAGVLLAGGAGAITSGSAEEVAQDLEAWSDVVPLDEDWKPPSFPIWVLPAPMREMVQASAKAHAVPVDLPAMIALGAVATLTARGVSVQPRPDWIAPANLYVTVVAGVGEAKTPVFNALVGPLNTIESEYRERQAPALSLAKAQKAAADKAVQRAQDLFAKGRGSLADLASAVQAADAVKVPNELRLVTNEPTPEALIQLCYRTGGTVAVVSDEGGEIFQLMSRYVMGNKSNLGVYLKGFDAQAYRSDRVGRDETIIDRLTLTVVLTLQPSVLIDIADDRANRDRGLLGRFLMVQPESRVGYRPSYRPSLPEEVSARWESLLRNIAQGVLDRPEPLVLNLSSEAESFFNNWFSFIETRLRPDTGDLRYCVDWANKAQGHVLRLAAVLHVAQGTPDAQLPERLQHGGLPKTTITFNTMSAACTLWEYCAEHAIHLFDKMGARPETQIAKKVLGWLKRNGIKDFSQRDAFQAVKGGIVSSVEELTAGLRVLEQHGYIRSESMSARSSPGKPPSPHFAVHPNIGGIGGTGTTLTPGAEGTEGLVLSSNNTTCNSIIQLPHCRWPRPDRTPNTPNIPPERVFCVICGSYTLPARQLPDDETWVGTCCATRYVETSDGPVPVDERDRCLICGTCDPLVGLDEVCPCLSG